MAPPVKALAVFAEDLGLALSTHIRQLTMACNSSSRDLIHRFMHTGSTETCTQENIHIYIKFKP